MFKFHSDEDPTTKQPIDFEFAASAFKKIEGASANKSLFQMAAYDHIAKSMPDEAI